jgi:hypothetical protein
VSHLNGQLAGTPDANNKAGGRAGKWHECDRPGDLPGEWSASVWRLGTVGSRTNGSQPVFAEASAGSPGYSGSNNLIRRSRELLADAEPEDGGGARLRAADRFHVYPGEAGGKEEADAVAEQHRQYIDQDLVDQSPLQALTGDVGAEDLEVLAACSLQFIYGSSWGPISRLGRLDGY